jgi:hypothetical protein
VGARARGVVAKKRSGRYVPGERSWVKAKNRAYEVSVLHRGHLSFKTLEPIQLRRQLPKSLDACSG